MQLFCEAVHLCSVKLCSRAVVQFCAVCGMINGCGAGGGRWLRGGAHCTLLHRRGSKRGEDKEDGELGDTW